MRSSSLKPAMHKAQVRLDKLPPGAVILDDTGQAWWSDRIYWYRAFGGPPESSWDLAQITGGTFTVVHPKEAT